MGGLEGGEVVLLACGWRHTLLSLANGDVYSWGRGVNGQLGHNEQRDLCARSPPVSHACSALWSEQELIGQLPAVKGNR